MDVFHDVTRKKQIFYKTKTYKKLHRLYPGFVCPFYSIAVLCTKFYNMFAINTCVWCKLASILMINIEQMADSNTFKKSVFIAV